MIHIRINGSSRDTFKSGRSAIATRVCVMTRIKQQDKGDATLMRATRVCQIKLTIDLSKRIVAAEAAARGTYLETSGSKDDVRTSP